MRIWTGDVNGRDCECLRPSQLQFLPYLGLQLPLVQALLEGALLLMDGQPQLVVPLLRRLLREFPDRIHGKNLDDFGEELDYLGNA